MVKYYFSGTRVFVARVGRQTKTREYKDLEAHFTANLGYSHHQKAVILDAPISKDIQNGQKVNSKVAPRRIIAYVGGIDLTGKIVNKQLKNNFGTFLHFSWTKILFSW